MSKKKTQSDWDNDAVVVADLLHYLIREKPNRVSLIHDCVDFLRHYAAKDAELMKATRYFINNNLAVIAYIAQGAGE